MKNQPHYLCDSTRKELSKILDPSISFEAEIDVPSESTCQKLWVVHLDKNYQELASGFWTDGKFFVENLGFFYKSQCHKTEDSASRHRWAMWRGNIASPDYDDYSYG
jgi:hypothetical protein